MNLTPRRGMRATALSAMTLLLACGFGSGGDGDPGRTSTDGTETDGTTIDSTTTGGPGEADSTTFGADDDECHTGCETTEGDVGVVAAPMALAIRHADGVGGFGEPQLVDLDLGEDAIGSYPVALFVADLNGDEHVDLLVYHSREVLALAGTEAGEFTALDSIEVDDLLQVVPADNADGTVGVLVYGQPGPEDERLLFHPWNGVGFDAQQGYPAPPLGSLGSGDLNGDGIADAIVAGRDELLDDGIDVHTFMNIGGGGVVIESHPNLVDSIAPTDLQTADLDGDGALDVVVTVDDHDYGRIESPVTGAIVLLPGDGMGAFGMPRATSFEYAPREALVGDFDGTDGLDVLVRDGTDQLHVALNDATGLLSPATLADEVYHLFDVGHVDDDARNDALATDLHLQVLEGQPGGAFDWVELDGGSVNDRAVLADVDGDGYDDVLYAVRR